MTLNMKNYKGYDKKPYCNAHCPQAKATTVADTPEIRRLAENTRIQSQAKYHEDFEKSKGKGFTAIADDPETVRIKNTSKIISNVSYHGEIERKKQMEEKRTSSGSEEGSHTSNNNFSKQHNRMRDQSAGPRLNENDIPLNQVNSYHNQLSQQQNLIHHQQQQQQLKQQQQHHIRAQGHNNQPMMNRHSQHLDLRTHQQVLHQPMAKQQSIPQQYIPVHPNQQQQQQQIIMRQQQQQMMMQRHSMDPSLAMNRQVSKQSLNNHNPIQQQHMIKQQMIQNHPQYLPVSDALRHQQSAHMGGLPLPQMMNPSHLGGQRMGQNLPGALTGVAQGLAHVPHGYSNHPRMGPTINGAPLSKQTQQQQQHHQQFVYNSNPASRQMPMHPSHMQQINQQPHPQQMQQTNQMPRRVFRAMYDYVANDVDEVSFFENDILLDCVNVDGNWLIGKVARSGQTGMLPANYVAEISG